MTSADGERALERIMLAIHSPWPWPVEVMNKIIEEVRRAQREKDAQSLEIPAASILLICGEMSAQEMRTVKAFLKNRAEAIRGEKA